MADPNRGGFYTDTPTTESVIGLLKARALFDADGAAIIGPTLEIISNKILLIQVEHISCVLASAGVRANDRVAVIASNGPEMAVLFLGIAVSASFAPLNPSYTDAELEFYLRDLDPRLLILERGLAPQALQVGQRLGIRTIEFAAGAQPDTEFRFVNGVYDALARAQFAAPDDVALVLHTSGTTARPKMVPLTQRNLCISAANIARSLVLTPSDRCLCIMPLFHIHGLIGAALATISSGGTLVCPGNFRTPVFFGWLRTFEPTWYTAVPTMHQAVLARAEQANDAIVNRSLRFIRSCSASLPAQVMTRLEELFGVPVVEAYGMTEAAHQIACNPLPPGRRKPGSVGIPAGTKVAIADVTGAFVPPGVEGEIVVQGPNIMDGYSGDPEVTRRALIGPWFRTGDLGRVDDEGYLFISGRLKDIINRGGEKISPREIDEVLLAHPAVQEAVAFAVPDARFGQDVGAAVVLKSGAAAPDAESLRHFASHRLAEFKLPRYIAFVDEIPKGPTGKIQRAGLAARLKLGREAIVPALQSASVSKSSATERILVSLWCEILQVKSIGREADFFDMGCDSLSAQIMLLEIERQWNVELTIADLLDSPTIAQLGRVIDSALTTAERPRCAIIQRGGSRPPFYCIGAGPRLHGLAKCLGSDQPFMAPMYPKPSTLPRPCRIEDIAGHHIETIRSVQPMGPYILGGWCVDGLVAYEVAQQLRAAGELVALLVLFDASFNPDPENGSWTSLIYAWLCINAGSLGFHLRVMFSQLKWSELPTYVFRHLRRIGERIDLWRRRCRFDRQRGGGERQREGGWREVSAIQRRAARRYRPRPYDGPVLLLRRSVRRTSRDEAAQDWGRFVRGPLAVHTIDGDHDDMFAEPQVTITAEKLRSCLENFRDEASILGVSEAANT